MQMANPINPFNTISRAVGNYSPDLGQDMYYSQTAGPESGTRILGLDSHNISNYRSIAQDGQFNSSAPGRKRHYSSGLQRR